MEFMNDVKRKTVGIAIDQVLKYMNKDREKHLLNLVDVTEKIAGDMFQQKSYEEPAKCSETAMVNGWDIFTGFWMRWIPTSLK